MLTPLSFNCTPELLSLERGRKIGLLQMAKKALLPRITASKLDPPVLTPAVAPPKPPTKDSFPPEPIKFPAAFDPREFGASPFTTSPPSSNQERVFVTPASPDREVSEKRKLSLSGVISTPLLRARPATSSGADSRIKTSSSARFFSSSTNSATLPAARPRFASTTSVAPQTYSPASSLPPSPLSFSDMFKIELDASSMNKAPEQGWSAITMWDAKANMATRPQKAVLLRPVTSRARTTTADQAVAVDQMLLHESTPPTKQQPKKVKLLRRPATADPSFSRSSHGKASPSGPMSHLRNAYTPEPPSPYAPSINSSAISSQNTSPLSSRFHDFPAASPNGPTLRGPITSREHIQAWIGLPGSHTPLYNLSNNHPSAIMGPLDPPPRHSSRSQPTKVTSVKRPSTAHEIRRKPPPIWDPEASP